jgi:predicted RNase H-like nuclease
MEHNINGQKMSITIIGIDCAVDEGNVGIAFGAYSDGSCSLLPFPNRANMASVEKLVCGWIDRSAQTLLALDAPLGWPITLGNVLVGHMAGGRMDISPDLLFRRATDRFVKSHFRKQPLDVGADRIARTARAALVLLDRIRTQTSLPIPLVWEPRYEEKAAAIEVYPAGTLVSRRLPASGYKKKEQIELRKQILGGLKHHMNLGVDLESAELNADALDAIVCVLSGADFLTGRAIPPSNLDEARKEGWIWISEIE